jgi:hypothetical protein
MKLLVPSLAAAAFVLPAPLIADPAPAATDAARQSYDAYMNERVCETITVTGSRVGGHRYCGTRAQWLQKQRDDREAIEKAQLSPCVLSHNSSNGKASC